ncbi:MAG: acyltransferase [Nostoc sp. ChiSLP02]|nr:acyltransferase [Nostoc sp. DedSLP05]MDZ8100801.1 acyltransferase [Nostoc sp. DedSLP01]MDZ8188210.1 acyltransferase [Nostoc sp. ChiSLP02]
MGFIRFLLALSVIVSHSTSIFGTTLLPGNHAVQLFFIISGFYMSLILDKKYTHHQFTTFISNRFLRLLPTYLIVLAASWVLFAMVWLYLGKMPATSWGEPFSNMPILLKLFTLFSNTSLFGIDLLSIFYIDTDGSIAILNSMDTGKTDSGLIWGGNLRVIGQAWSIGVEIWFYFLAPLLFRISTSKLLIIIFLTAILKIFLFSIGSNWNYFFFLPQLCFFCLGILIYKEKFFPSIHLGKIAIISCWILFNFLVIAFPFIGESSLSFIYIPLIYLVFAILLKPLFLLTSQNKIDRFIGNLSYPMYVSHMLLIQIQTLVIKTNNGLIAVILTTIFSSLLVLYIEEPIDKFRQSRIEYSNHI